MEDLDHDGEIFFTEEGENVSTEVPGEWSSMQLAQKVGKISKRGNPAKYYRTANILLSLFSCIKVLGEMRWWVKLRDKYISQKNYYPAKNNLSHKKYMLFCRLQAQNLYFLGSNMAGFSLLEQCAEGIAWDVGVMVAMGSQQMGKSDLFVFLGTCSQSPASSTGVLQPKIITVQQFL